MSQLTAWQTCVQSAAIHPDWDAVTHAHYLVNEEFFEPSRVECLPIDKWLDPSTEIGKQFAFQVLQAVEHAG